MSECHSDSEAFAGKEYRYKFLSLPRPKNLGENALYFEIFQSKTVDDHRFLLDISEATPVTGRPRQWVYGDGTPVSWTNWRDGEPNNHQGSEPLVEVDPDGFWNDVKDRTEHKYMCVYYLPVGAENTCPWLRDFQARR